MNALLPHVVGGDGEELQTLEIQVNLCAAASRLEHPEEGISDLFQHVLDLQFWGKSPKATTQQTGSNDVLNSCVDEQANYLDVLILYDDSDNDDGSLPDIVTKAQQLKKLMKQTFNLRVKCNKEREPVGLSLYPEEMLFFKTVIVLVDGETEHETRRDSLFAALLDYIPIVRSQCETNRRPAPAVILALTSRDTRSVVSLKLQPFRRIFLDDVITALSETSMGADPMEDSPRQNGGITSPATNFAPEYKRNPLVNEENNQSGPPFSPMVTSKIEFFCLLLAREWPSCKIISG